MILSIDPGNTMSAYIAFGGGKLIDFDKIENRLLLARIRSQSWYPVTDCYIETMKPRGMPTSFEEMQTQLWAGRFWEAFAKCYGTEPTAVFRHDVKIFHCGRGQAKDSNIRQALIDRFGGKEAAIGKKKTPGPLHGVSNDVWSALAIAVYAWETKQCSPAAGQE